MTKTQKHLDRDQFLHASNGSVGRFVFSPVIDGDLEIGHEYVWSTVYCDRGNADEILSLVQDRIVLPMPTRTMVAGSLVREDHCCVIVRDASYRRFAQAIVTVEKI